MSEKRYYWIKLNRDFFNTNEVKYLMSKVGDIGILTYQKMILYSADSAGKIELKGLFDGDMSKEIALYINAEPEHVEAVLDTLSELGMITKSQDGITISGVSEMVGSETDRAVQMRKKREEMKNEEHFSQSVTQNVHDVHRERDRERDRDRYKEKDIKRKDKEGIHEKIFNLFSETCVSLPRIKKLTDARKKAIDTRLKSYSIEDLEMAFQKAEESDFLTGKNDRGWKADFDWIMQPKNLQKILEGVYDNGEKKRSVHEVFKGHTQQEYTNDPLAFADFTKLEGWE